MPCGLAGAVGVADVDGAPVDGLAVLLRLGLHGEHPADDQRAGDLVAGPLERLELEAEGGQRVGELLDVEVVGQVDVVPDPGHGGTHAQISVPKADEKRTSPSKKSRRSAAPCRNIRVRSMPMPKAKPV